MESSRPYACATTNNQIDGKLKKAKTPITEIAQTPNKTIPSLSVCIPTSFVFVPMIMSTQPPAHINTQPIFSKSPKIRIVPIATQPHQVNNPRWFPSPRSVNRAIATALKKNKNTVEPIQDLWKVMRPGRSSAIDKPRKTNNIVLRENLNLLPVILSSFWTYYNLNLLKYTTLTIGLQIQKMVIYYLQMKKNQVTKKRKTQKFGEHMMFDAYQCDYKALNSMETCYEVLNHLAELANMNKMLEPLIIKAEGNSTLGGKDPGGYSGFLIIEESHVSIHTFAKRGFVTIDLYSCKSFPTEGIEDYLQSVYKTEDISIIRMDRGLKYPIENIY